MLDPPVIATQDHLRCTNATAKGPCRFEAVTPGGFCKICSSQAAKTEKKSALYAYLVQRDRREVVDHPDKYTLKEEAGILRILLSSLLTKLDTSPNDPHALLRMTPQISELVTKIQSTVQAAIKCDKMLENLMDREQITIIAQKLINVLAENITDTALIEKIAVQFEEIISGQQNPS